MGINPEIIDSLVRNHPEGISEKDISWEVGCAIYEVKFFLHSKSKEGKYEQDDNGYWRIKDNRKEAEPIETINVPNILPPVIQPRELTEQEKLELALKERKVDADKILQELQKQGIEYLYHFTDIRNLSSIKEQKGLYSRGYCEKHNINIPKPGGDKTSTNLDKIYGLEDYVRLCFVKDHPMSCKLQKSRIPVQIGNYLYWIYDYRLVWLKIKIDVALAKETLFSDMNATKNGHHHGSTFVDFQMIDFEAVKALHPKNDSPLYHKHQAEVLVKTFIPIEYIVNIDNPDPYVIR